MRKAVFILSSSLIILFNSCTNPWDNRFDENQAPPDKTIWEVLNENPDYSDFVSLMIETGYDSILQRNTTFSVFVPLNPNMINLEGFSNEQKRNIAAFHISNSIIYSNDMKEVNLRTLSGKFLSIVNSNGSFILNNESTITQTNIRAENGVIHEISSLQLIKPNLFEYINSNPEYSSVSDYFNASTTLIFDETNSIPIGIDDIGQTIFDSTFIYQNDFFSNIADIASEEERYTIFLAGNTLLDTTANGSFKSSYVNNFGNYTVQGIINPEEVPSVLTGVTGISFPMNNGAYRFLGYASNGGIFELLSFEGFKFPRKFSWEITDISEFDSVRHIKSTEFASVYNNFTNIKVSDLTGGFNNFKYQILSGPLNKDYLKISSKPGTYATISINLPDIIPGVYNLALHAQKRVADGAVFDCYFNDDPANQDVSLNGGLYKWKDINLGEINVTKETGNILKLKVDGSSSAKTKLYMDYFTFEPAN